MSAMPLLVLFVVLLLMLAELFWSQRNERLLLRAGAVTAADEVYATMRWAYPATFVAMALEGALRGMPPAAVVAAGLAVFIVGKVLKGWAIATLGTRWTYRVLVLPGVPLVRHGPYRFMRHPNYVGVIGELVGMALLVGAALTGPLSVLGFGLLLSRRIAGEERAMAAALAEPAPPASAGREL